MDGIIQDYMSMSKDELEDELKRVEDEGITLRWQTNMSTRASNSKSFAARFIDNGQRVTDLKVRLGMTLYDWQRPYGKYGAGLLALRYMSMEKHKEIVKKALDKGYPVPTEVLIEYPDIAIVD